MTKTTTCPNCGNPANIIDTHVGRTSGTIIGGFLGALAGVFVRLRFPFPPDFILPYPVTRSANTLIGLFTGASLGHDVGAALAPHLINTHHCPKCEKTFVI